MNGFLPGRVTFEPLRTSDLRLMHRWLSDPYLVQIWLNGKPASYSDIEKKYLPRIQGREPTDPYLIACNDMPVGYVQSYLWKDYPETSKYFEPEERNASSLDIFIGEPEYRGKGLGPMILRSFLESVVFRKYNADTCMITPLAENTRAIRAYEKAGFRKARLLDHPDEPSTICLMIINRETAAASGINSLQ